MFHANASSGPLPTTTPSQLLADIKSADVSGYSGTVVSQLALGLPPLAAIGVTGDTGGPSFVSLLSGSHTLQVWYGGPEKERVALLGSEDETDMFREGREVWQWNSADRVAVHTQLPADSPDAGSVVSSGVASMSPDQLSRKLLDSLDRSTRVTVTTGREVADRSTYDLVLTPRGSATKIASARIAVDGATKLPLGVRVYARGATTPALDIAFTNIRIGRQAERNFEFSPPPGATVQRGTAASRPVATTTGTGWTTVFGTDIGKSAAAKITQGALGKTLKPVSGSWGRGRLLDSALVSVLVTDDGRVFAGAVEPSGLYAAAGK